MPVIHQRFAAAIILIISSVLTSAGLRAQDPQPALSQQEQVKLNVIVLDNEKHAVADLRKDELQVLEGDKPQSLSSLERDTRPLRLGLVVDNSGSLKTQFREVVETVRSIIIGKAQADEMLLVRFVDSERIEVVQDFTSDQSLLLIGLRDLGLEGGQSAVIDAVYLSLNKLATRQATAPYRSALILITDGEDRSSYYKQDELLKLLREKEVQVFIIGLLKELDKESGLTVKSPRERAEELLTKLAQETGGRVFFPNSNKELPMIVDELMSSLRTQFVVGYTPAAKPKSKSYRKVKVKLLDATGRDKRTVIARPGYTAPPK